MKIISIAVRDFALPVPRVGSIESHSGYGRVSAEGQEIHLRVQAGRTKADSNYRPEVKLVGEFERDGYRFQIGGRIDGLFDSNPPRIEEIKSTFSIKDLERKLSQNSQSHPYCLQLKTYGYLYLLEHQVTPELSFHLVSTRNYESDDLKLAFDREEYEKWFMRRLDELVDEVRKAEKRIERRQKMAGEFPFPFENPRSGQVELVQAVEEGMGEKRRMLIQAPTGLGKTVGVLYPALKEAMSRGQKVIYVTPKNSQHSVAEDAMERFHDAGCKVRSLTITAKSKICFKNEPLCNPDYCEYAKDHYAKVYDNGLIDRLSRKRKLTYRTFREMGEQYQVCPFELQLEAAADVETVICDYNYVFAPRTAFGRMNAGSLGGEGNPNLVIDEAHNLLSRAMDYYSPSLSTYVLEKMRPAIKELPSLFRNDAETLLNECLITVASCHPEGATKTQKIDPPEGAFLEQEGSLRAFLSRYLDSDVEIQPRDVAMRLCFYWSEFTAALEFVTTPKRPEFFTTFQPHSSGGGTVKITCCDASEMLEACYDDYEQVVGFSATLKPFDYYAKLSGLDLEKLKVAEFQSPFPKEKRKLLIIPEISTKYSDRERNSRKISEVIRRISAVRPGNYFAFFPSFDFMGRVADSFEPPPGFVILKQERDMKTADVNSIIEHLRNQQVPTIVFAVQGGVFSEGVDYPGETVIGAFVVGPPLPNFDLEREQMREYYQENYGAGFDYAYTFPAMSKAVQAAGRVIRSETDRGIIVLMDNRFINPSYSRSMPTDWFGEKPNELVSNQILKDVTDFWRG
jgi:DNA excision repair protein ERCC-2